MAGCDFSTHPYSYDDVKDDVNLTYFSLTEEDYFYKVKINYQNIVYIHFNRQCLYEVK